VERNIRNMQRERERERERKKEREREREREDTAYTRMQQCCIPVLVLECQYVRRRQWKTTPVQLNLPRKSSVGSPGV